MRVKYLSPEDLGEKEDLLDYTDYSSKTFASPTVSPHDSPDHGQTETQPGEVELENRREYKTGGHQEGEV